MADLPPSSSTDPQHVLATYGSLAPGRDNHWVISKISGTWIKATVSGWAFEIGWGPAEGWQGFMRDPQGPDVPVDVLISDALPKNWRTIDEFEGAGYERREIEITLDNGSTLTAQIYEALADAE